MVLLDQHGAQHTGRRDETAGQWKERLRWAPWLKLVGLALSALTAGVRHDLDKVSQGISRTLASPVST